MMERELEWVDSHCHLEMLKGDVHAALKKSFQSGMAYCITIGTSPSANKKIVSFCQSIKRVYGTLGCHPHNASKFDIKELDWVKQQIELYDTIVGIGECGFDLYYEHSDRSLQKIAFDAQLSLAIEIDMPVVIHAREADQLTRDVLEPYRSKNITGVVHSITSDLDQARFLLDFGFYLSFNGICTFSQAESVRDVLKFTPPDRILLETDAPYLSPEPYRGKPNIPGNVALVGKYVAELLNISQEQLAQQTARNTKTLFPRISYER